MRIILIGLLFLIGSNVFASSGITINNSSIPVAVFLHKNDATGSEVTKINPYSITGIYDLKQKCGTDLICKISIFCKEKTSDKKILGSIYVDMRNMQNIIAWDTTSFDYYINVPSSNDTVNILKRDGAGKSGCEIQ